MIRFIRVRSIKRGTYGLTLFAHGQAWIITWREGTRIDALRTLGRWAANPQLDFSWRDAAEFLHEFLNLEMANNGSVESQTDRGRI